MERKKQKLQSKATTFDQDDIKIYFDTAPNDERMVDQENDFSTIEQRIPQQ